MICENEIDFDLKKMMNNDVIFIKIFEFLNYVDIDIRYFKFFVNNLFVYYCFVSTIFRFIIIFIQFRYIVNVCRN